MKIHGSAWLYAQFNIMTYLYFNKKGQMKVNPAKHLDLYFELGTTKAL